MLKRSSQTLLPLLTALLLALTGAACGGDDHAHGPGTHTCD